MRIRYTSAGASLHMPTYMALHCHKQTYCILKSGYKVTCYAVKPITAELDAFLQWQLAFISDCSRTR
jgi:hypothetical protein